MLKITVNETTPFDVSEEEGTWYLNGTRFEGNIARLSDTRYHVLWKNRSFEVEVVEHHPTEKRATFKINGHPLTTTAKNRVDLLLESMGLNTVSSTRINEIKAPMPGLIQSVAVRAGDVVKKGDTLLVLVAMKMENALKAPGDATVKAIRIEPGCSAEKNQVLIEFA